MYPPEIVKPMQLQLENAGFTSLHTAQEVENNIKKELWRLVGEERVKVMVIPDIESVNFGRGVGYDIIEHIPPQEVSEISATKIREQLKQEGKL